MLLTEIENARGRTLVIFAGYKDKMGRLLAADPGLPSRFPWRVHIAPYTFEEIAEVIALKARATGLELEPELQPRLADFVMHKVSF